MSNCPLYKPFYTCTSSIASTDIPPSLPISSSPHLSISIKPNDDAHTTHPLSCLIHIVKFIYACLWVIYGNGWRLHGVTMFRVLLFSFVFPTTTPLPQHQSNGTSSHSCPQIEPSAHILLKTQYTLL